MITMQQDDRYLTPQEVADRLQLATSTVLQWLRQKRLPGRQFGNRWRIKSSELEAWEKAREEANNS